MFEDELAEGGEQDVGESDDDAMPDCDAMSDGDAPAANLLDVLAITTSSRTDGIDENHRLAELRDRPEQPKDKWQLTRLFRTCLSSLLTATAFGLAMSREAGRRRFGDAVRMAFVADGLGWNWSIWKKYFRDYTPIWDFVHVAQATPSCDGPRKCWLQRRNADVHAKQAVIARSDLRSLNTRNYFVPRRNLEE